MKVLWFSVTPSLYGKNNNPHNGGGWIESLEKIIKQESSIQLGIAFEHSDKTFKRMINGVTYYPIKAWRFQLHEIYSKYIKGNDEKYIIPACIKIINDFSPDIIHVFGAEWSFGLIPLFTNIPVIIHLQGCMPAYYNARFPAGYSIYDIFLYNGLNIKNIFKQLLIENSLRLRAKREERILTECRYFLGRTEWDKNIALLYSPKSKYYYCSEALRDPFINSNVSWQPRDRKKKIFMSTISSPIYKGMDLILKAAFILTTKFNLDFEWRIFGIQDLSFHEKKTKIRALNVRVKLMGIISADELKDELLNTDIFIHPSYIDNSPNSICEAQILGVPIISTNVGGISSLIEHNITGLLVPANDPYMLCSLIIKLINDVNISINMSRKAEIIAKQRHSQTNILNDLVKAYSEVMALGK